MSPAITEIAPDVYRICVLDPDIDLQFNHFLVKDDEPLLFHTGLRRMWELSLNLGDGRGQAAAA
jgi:hypothetical protein